MVRKQTGSHKWTRACDRRLARLISYIHHTGDYRQYCHGGNAAQHCRLGPLKDSDFAGDLEDSNSTSGGILCIFGSRTLVPTRWISKKQTSVLHSSSESEVISLDAGLHMDGIPARDLWDVLIEVLHSSKNTHQAVRNHCRKEEVDDQVPRNRARSEIQSTNSNTKTKRHGNREVEELSNVDHVVTSGKLFQCKAELYIFEDNEAVIRMII